MRETLWVRGTQLLVKLDQVNGRKGADVHMLTISLEIKGRRDLVGCALTLAGQLSVSLSRGGVLHMGQLHSSATPTVFIQDAHSGEMYHRRSQLTIDISPSQLEAIEEVRRGTEVELLLDINGLGCGSRIGGALLRSIAVST
jgi:hypothetical protein